MSGSTQHGPARSREQLLHLLAEASEVEHNLLCSYLFAAFSLKTGADEGLTTVEREAVKRWRATLMAVCVEEMIHLAQVANLMVAVGAAPHFDRPNLPVAPGYHPAGIRVALTRFDRATLDHFVYLERPERSDDRDPRRFSQAAAAATPRRAPRPGLMPSAPDYDTIGEFYAIVEEDLAALCARIGEARVFIGPVECQLTGDEIHGPEPLIVTDLASARRAIETIVSQGEGTSGDRDDSHHRRFVEMREEFERLLAARPAFDPARPVATNPVMHPPQAAERVHVTGALSAPVLDAANAIYSLMLRCLVQLYATPRPDAELRGPLLAAVFELMHAFGEVATALTALPATDDAAQPTAGASFAMLRSTEGFAPGVDPRGILASRCEDIASRIDALALPAHTREACKRRLHAIAASFRVADAQASPMF